MSSTKTKAAGKPEALSIGVALFAKLVIFRIQGAEEKLAQSSGAIGIS